MIFYKPETEIENIAKLFNNIAYDDNSSYGAYVGIDEDGNAVTQINAYQVYVLELYAENTNMYTIGNFVAEGMTTYFGDVSYEDYVA